MFAFAFCFLAISLLGLVNADQYTSDTDFRSTILNVTNSYRKQHNATALTWNDTLADTAGDWSEKCNFEHSGGPTGENLASGYPNASASILAWGHERVSYDYKKAEFSSSTGHFTQLVWKATTQVGCGRTNCTGRGNAPGWFVVCEYYPAGNVVGAFGENVQSQVGGKEGDVPDDRSAAGGLRVGWWIGGVVGVVVLGVL